MYIDNGGVAQQSILQQESLKHLPFQEWLGPKDKPGKALNGYNLKKINGLALRETITFSRKSTRQQFPPGKVLT
jgi:hypothetical protein